MDIPERPSDIPVVLRRFSWRGLWLCFRASHQMGIAERLRRTGDHAKALETALDALDVLRDPHVYRFAPGPFVEIIEAAKFVYELATIVGRPEAAVRPLEEALELACKDSPHADDDVPELTKLLRAARAAIENRSPD